MAAPKKTTRNASKRTTTDRKARLDAATAEVGATISEARQVAAAKAKERYDALNDEHRALVEQRGVPLWAVRLHSKIGHVGGLLVFVIGAGVSWAAGITLAITFLQILGVQIITSIPGHVLTQLGVSPTTATGSTDRFIFTWVLPVLFFTLVAAGLTVLGLRSLIRIGIAWTRRLALGLFAGYGYGVITDWRERRADRIAATSVRKAAKQERRERMDAVRNAAEQ